MSFLLLYVLSVITFIYYFLVVIKFSDGDYKKKDELYKDLIPFSAWIKSFLKMFNSLE